MASIEEICARTSTWARMTRPQREEVVGILREYVDLGNRYAERAIAALFATDVPDYDTRYRRFLAGDGPHPGHRGLSAFENVLVEMAQEGSTFGSYSRMSGTLIRSGYLATGSTPSVIRRNLDLLASYGAPRADHLVTMPEVWVKYAAPDLIESVTREARQRWNEVTRKLSQRRRARECWVRDRGLSWIRAGELAKQGVLPLPDFNDAKARKSALKLPPDLQPKCQACGKVAHQCRCEATDTCGHFARSTRKDGACPVCRASKASRNLRTDYVEVEPSGHFRGIPMTRGEGRDTVSFWGKAPGKRGKRPKIPRYVGCEIEVENFQRRARFWDRVPSLAKLVQKWHFSIGEDGSLGSDGREARLSPARGREAEAQITEVVNALRECGAKITKNCGLHIHVDAADFTESAQFNALLQAWDIVEPKLFAKMPDRRSNTYCKSTKGKRVQVVGNDLLFDREASTRKDGDPIYDRYHAVNLANMQRLTSGRKTIEFRIFEGCLEAEQIVTWAHIVSTLVHHAAKCDSRLTTPQGIASLLRPDAVAYLGLES